MQTLIKKKLAEIATEHRNKVLEEAAQNWDKADIATRNNFSRFLRSEKEAV